jgi:hypothetical protein
MILQDINGNIIKFINNLNYIFSNNFFRFLALLFASVFAGYILQPVPEWLNNLFNTSNLFKYFILVIVGIITVYPLDEAEIVYIFIGSAIILILFEFMRNFDKVRPNPPIEFNDPRSRN